ncbi:MAG: CDP-diacylglycerol--glycerol-3-phosphate 3-phosphatidyltransferase [Gammaproteobacteria bacterium]|jgi:CDP-diacylglycerol--glycerol-3-phosphate 3-phosphatidyltransferase|nr:CDP-diacylglycerol--glycerol-3-phosphate 3-phosphatidyltransferase [Gammaproteobacteria bacterium]
MPLTTPNLLTLFRMALIPVVVVLYFMPIAGVYVTAVFLLAGLTDWLDGYLARRLEQTSQFGEFLDPVADKLVVAAVLVLLVSDGDVLARVVSQKLFIVAVVVIIGREIAVSALREWVAQSGARAGMAVSTLGKVKTTVQIIAIALLLYSQDLVGFPTLLVGELMLYVASALTIWSMVGYLKSAWPAISSGVR